MMSDKNELGKHGIDDNALDKMQIPDYILFVAYNYWCDSFRDCVNRGNYDDAYSSNVFKMLNKLCDKPNVRSLRIGTKLFRARIIDYDDLINAKNGIDIENRQLKGYNWINSKEPPIGLSEEGRANSKYSSYFYCSKDEYTAASEVKASIDEFISLAEFRTKRTLKLIDLSKKNDSNDGNLEQYIYQQSLAYWFSKPARNTVDYKFTQFVSDEIRKLGMDGICYKSHFTNLDNLVIFNCSMNNTLDFVDSRIIRLHSQQLNFVDFSCEQVLSTKCDENITTEDIQEEKLKLISIIESHKRNIESVLEETKND
mgnify:CR=1 FL=1